MAKVRKVGYDPNKVESGSNFVDHPAPAVVKVKCVTANLEETFKSGADGAHLVFDIIKKPPAKNKKWGQLHLRYVYYDNEEEAWMEAQVMDALIGKRVKQYGSTALVGKTCLAQLREEEYQGQPKPGIKALLPLDADEFEEDDEDEDDEEPEDEDEEDVDDDEEEEEDEDEEEEDEDEEEDDYNDWSLAQLRAELKRRELDSKGKKDALVERLEEDDAEEEEEEEEEEEGEDYSEYSTTELKAELRRRGLKVKRGMSDEDLIEALEEDDEDEEDPLEDDE